MQIRCILVLQLLNFLAFSDALVAPGSPLRIRSAPTFFPLVGHPYLGLKTLLHNLQEETSIRRLISTKKNLRFFMCVIACFKTKLPRNNCFRHSKTTGKVKIFRNYLMISLYFSLISKPICIADIIIGDSVNFAVDHFLRDIFYFPGGNACINTSGFANCTFSNYGTGSNDGIAVYYRTIHDNSTHANQNIIMNCTTMYDSIMPD